MGYLVLEQLPGCIKAPGERRQPAEAILDRDDFQVWKSLENSFGDHAEDVRSHGLGRPNVLFEIKRGPPGAGDWLAVRAKGVRHDFQSVLDAGFVDWPVLSTTHRLVRAAGELDLDESLVMGAIPNLLD